MEKIPDITLRYIVWLVGPSLSFAHTTKYMRTIYRQMYPLYKHTIRKPALSKIYEDSVGYKMSHYHFDISSASYVNIYGFLSIHDGKIGTYPENEIFRISEQEDDEKCLSSSNRCDEYIFLFDSSIDAIVYNRNMIYDLHNNAISYAKYIFGKYFISPEK